MATEKLNFRLELYGEYWDKPPHVQVFLQDTCYFDGVIKGTKEKPVVVDFAHELEEGKEYGLNIGMLGKGFDQTLLDREGNIVKDQLLHIKNINIDEIDIGALLYEGVYTPKYPEPWATQQRESGNPQPESFKNVTKMGHNGLWSLRFSSPFYMWLLENLY